MAVVKPAGCGPAVDTVDWSAPIDAERTLKTSRFRWARALL